MNRLIVVSNRLPFALDSAGEDLWTVTPATGGLVSAVEPVLRERGGTWIGWPGTAGEIPQEPLAKATRYAGYEVVPVALSETERDEFYYGYSNEVIWPLFHDLQNFCNFEPAYWQTYKEVNNRYADAIARCAQPDDFIWVHDYHLMYVAEALRERGVSPDLSRLPFFLHIPFPPYDIFSKLPQQQRLLRALLQFDLVGFQTRRDVRNFIQCVRRVMSEAKVLSRRELQLIRFEDHEIRVGYFPIGIDFDSFEKSARSDSVEQRAQRLRATFPGCQLILGSDRLDYSKGIPERLRAFRTALERYPELSGRVVLIQIVVPSRVEIPRYHEFKQRIDRLVGDINGRFSTSTWLPVRHRVRHAAQGWDESRSQGILCMPNRQRWRADPEPVRRRGRATQARCVAGQSLRYRGNGGHDFESFPHEPGRAQWTHEADETRGSEGKCVLVGRFISQSRIANRNSAAASFK